MAVTHKLACSYLIGRLGWLYQKHGFQPVSVHVWFKASDIQCAGIVAYCFLQEWEHN